MERLKELRVLAGITQYQLAKKLSTTQTTIGKYERGELEPNLQNLIKLSHIFECSVDYLIENSDDLGVIQVYPQTDKLDSLNADEQKLIDFIRKNPPLNATEWIELYAELPHYMQESIFAELRGMYLGYKAAKAEKAAKEKK